MLIVAKSILLNNISSIMSKVSICIISDIKDFFPRISNQMSDE